MLDDKAAQLEFIRAMFSSATGDRLALRVNLMLLACIAGDCFLETSAGQKGVIA